MEVYRERLVSPYMVSWFPRIWFSGVWVSWFPDGFLVSWFPDGFLVKPGNLESMKHRKLGKQDFLIVWWFPGFLIVSWFTNGFLVSRFPGGFLFLLMKPGYRET